MPVARLAYPRPNLGGELQAEACLQPSERTGQRNSSCGGLVRWGGGGAAQCGAEEARRLRGTDYAASRAHRHSRPHRRVVRNAAAGEVRLRRKGRDWRQALVARLHGRALALRHERVREPGSHIAGAAAGLSHSRRRRPRSPPPPPAVPASCAGSRVRCCWSSTPRRQHKGSGAQRSARPPCRAPAAAGAALLEVSEEKCRPAASLFPRTVPPLSVLLPRRRLRLLAVAARCAVIFQS